MQLKRVIRAAATFGLMSIAGPAFAESLQEALASAYINNPQIASALLSVKASAEDIALRKAGKLPTISASTDLSASWTLSNGTQSDTKSSSVGLTYSQVLFDNLKTDAQIEQARALSVVASETLRNSEQNVLLQAATAYVAVIRDTRLVQLRADNVKFFQAQVSSADSRKQIGEGTAVDVSQAQASLAQAVASYKSAIASLKTSQASYERWIGHKPRNLRLGYNFGSALPNSLDEALALSEKFHPAILSAKAQLRAAQSASDAAKAAFGPTLNLIGNIGGSFSSHSILGNTNSGSGSIKLTLSVPLYAGGAMGATVRKANLNQIKGEIDALAARDQVRESVISSWAGLQNASAQIDSAIAAVRASQLSLDGVIEQQRVGQLTTLDVLNARTSLTGVQEAQISAETSRVVAAFSLIAASGRLSARDLGLPVTLTSGKGYIQKVEDVWQELRAVAQ
jgi:outer membrane protein